MYLDRRGQPNKRHAARYGGGGGRSGLSNILRVSKLATCTGTKLARYLGSGEVS